MNNQNENYSGSPRRISVTPSRNIQNTNSDIPVPPVDAPVNLRRR